MTGGAGRESSTCTGANSSPPHSAMRLLFDVCQEVVFCPELGKRDSVARTPTVTTRRAIATKKTLPIAVARELPRRAAHRAILNKLFTPARICPRTSRGLILHQLPVDHKENCKRAPQGAADKKPPIAGKPDLGIRLPGTEVAMRHLGVEDPAGIFPGYAVSPARFRRFLG